MSNADNLGRKNNTPYNEGVTKGYLKMKGVSP